MQSKYCAPTKLDTACQKTVWRVIEDEKSPSAYYIQVKEGHRSHWIPMSEFLETAFKNFFEDEAFISECFNRYIQNTTKDH